MKCVRTLCSRSFSALSPGNWSFRTEHSVSVLRRLRYQRNTSQH